jgi:hypothetical protein
LLQLNAMPIFSRRRLQNMIDDLRPLLETKKTNDILARLSAKKPEQGLAAEMELALLWGIQKITNIEIEPALPTSKRPEALSVGLFDNPSYIEITTLSDGRLSGEESMQRATHKITDYTNTIRKGCGNYLVFTFNEISFWEDNIFKRERRITDDFELDQPLKDRISAWIKISPDSQTQPLLLQNNDIDVLIEYKTHRQKQGFNVFSSLPPLAYDIEDNPLYARLKEKTDQLSGVPDGALKVIFVADGGSKLLRQLHQKDPLNRYKSGADIIQRFIDKSSIDAVCVFSPLRQRSLPLNSDRLYWRLSLFCPSARPLDGDKLKKLAEILPNPRLEGYQARSLYKQGMFNPTANGWYLSTEIRTGNPLIMKISARLLQEYLAGKVSKDEFERLVFGEKNPFGQWLQQGHTISNVKFENAGIDEDDDYVIFEFMPNPSASCLM